MRIDLRRSLRRIKPQKWTGSLAPRHANDLDFVESAEPFGPPLLLDTCVYLDTLEGRLPAAAKDLIRSRPLRHVSVVLGELTHFFGRLAPSPASAAILQKLGSSIEFIDPDQLNEPTAGVSLEAGILCGLVFRLGVFQSGQEVSALIDATIFLHALENGLTILTRNYRDFDRMNQIMPATKVLFYRPV